MGYDQPEDLRIVEQAENLCDAIWDEVTRWDYFAKDTVGKQIVKAADSIGANIVEACGRHHQRDVINFLYFSRGSLNETRFWLRRASKRRLLTKEGYGQFLSILDNPAPQLNSFISKKRSCQKQPNHLTSYQPSHRTI
jgi:four helix bundle protein